MQLQQRIPLAAFRRDEPAAASARMSPQDLKSAFTRAKRLGRGGDNDIVHVNPAEERMLKESGGSGTINPRTGLREFEGGGLEGGSNNGNKIGAAHDDTRSSGGGGGGNGASSGQFTKQGNLVSPSVRNQTSGDQENAAQNSPDSVRADLSRSFTSSRPTGTGLRGPTGPSDPNDPNSPQLAGHTSSNSYAGDPRGQKQFNSDGSESRSGGVGSNYEGAVSDYANLDGFSKMFESPPNINQPATFKHGLAHTGTNPLGLLASFTSLLAPGSGVLTAPLGNWIGRKLGIPDIVVGDASPGVPGNEIHDFSSPQGNAGGALGQPGSQNGLTRLFTRPVRPQQAPSLLSSLVTPHVYSSNDATIVT